jgi:integrase
VASVYRHARGGWYCALSLASGRSQIFLGGVTKAQAQTIAGNLDALVASNRIGQPPSPRIAEWLGCCDRDFVGRLEKLGILRLWAQPTTTPNLLAYWDKYVDRRSDLSGSTVKGFHTARLHVRAFFGDDRSLESVTVEESKQFARDLVAGGLSSSHSEKIVERLKQVFEAAVNSGALAANPLADVSIRGVVDRTRKQYVPTEIAAKVLEQIATPECRAAFALARWCGLRTPHEHLALTWQHVDWAQSRLTIPAATKTGSRVLPLFPLALRELSALDELAPSGATYIFVRNRRSAAVEWRRQLERAILLAGVPQWSKLWVNLRASCRTDLEDRFPSHVCDAWLGHSTRVARDHYLQVTPDHWQTATNPAHSAPDLHSAAHSANRAERGSGGV